MSKTTLHFNSAIELKAASGKKIPRIEILAYAGGVMTAAGWGNVVIDLSGLDCRDQVPLLVDHRCEVAGVIGSGIAQVKNGGQLWVTGTLSDTEAARSVLNLAKDGLKLEASVGVEVERHERLEPGQTIRVNGREVRISRPVVLVQTGVLREVSVTPAGADKDTIVNVAARHTGEFNMSKTKDNQSNHADDTTATLSPQQGEAKRIEAVRALCKDDPDLAAEAVREGWSEKITGRIYLERLRASRPASIPNFREAGIPVDPSQLAGNRPRNFGDHQSHDTLTAALLLHAGFQATAEKEYGERVCYQASRLQIHSLYDLCRAALTMEGQAIPSTSNAMVRAALSTYSMPVTLGAGIEKIALDAFQNAPATWRLFAKVLPLPNFKEHKTIRPTLDATLEAVGTGGEVKYGTIEEATSNIQIDQFAKNIFLDRRDVINDDLGIFNDVAPGLGRNAMRSLNDLVWGVIMENAGDFFSAGNGNYKGGADTLLSTDALSAGIKAILNQVDSKGRNLDIRPRVLAVPPSLDFTAKQLLNSAEVARYVASATDNQPTGNPLRESLTLATEPRLENSNFTGSSGKTWYLFGSPLDAAVVVGFLNGQESPTIESFTPSDDPDRLAYGWRVLFDYGSSLCTPQSAYKAKGEE